MHKEERICSRKQIERLFGGGDSRAVSAYPLRAVYLLVERGEGEPSVQLLVSVPKRCFKRAVKRNRVKRQVREAFRRHKAVLTDRLTAQPRQKLLVAFIWQDIRLRESVEVEKRVSILMERIAEKI